jgi:hypothetical protein
VFKGALDPVFSDKSLGIFRLTSWRFVKIQKAEITISFLRQKMAKSYFDVLE